MSSEISDFSPSIDKRLGWRKDKYDARDYKHKARLVALPDAVDLSKYLPIVRNQGSVGSCTGFGIGGNITATAKKLGVHTEWFSPWWIYNGGRFLEGTLAEDAGAYPRDCFDWLLKKGCLLEQFWKYADGTFRLDKTSPPSKFDPEAAKYPLIEYIRITDGSTNIMDVLAQEYLVSVGVPWYNPWMDAPKGVLPNVTASTPVAGGHEVLIYGYNKTHFMVMNSWGTNYGNKGFCLMQKNVFDGIFQGDGGYDAHYARVNWGAAPVPPSPTPGAATVRLGISTDDKTWQEVSWAGQQSIRLPAKYK